MDASKSTLIARFDPAANAINRRPAISGSFSLASDGVKRSFRAWSGVAQSGRLYLRGTHEPEGLSIALKERHAAAVEAEAPASVSLNPGELVLFENLAIADNEKRPNWYGYARLAEGYVRLSAWDKKTWTGGKLLAGTVEPYRPADGSRELELSDTPAHG
jgi:hypothetical protein